MAKMRRKADLPVKVCDTCGRPFAWRRKWAKVWDEVRFCSDRCRRARRRCVGSERGSDDGSCGRAIRPPSSPGPETGSDRLRRS